MTYSDKQLEMILYNYKELMSMLASKEEAFGFAPWKLTDTNSGGGASNRTTNPTETIALNLIEGGEEQVRQYVKAIQSTYSNMPVDQKRMMEVYYFERSYGMREKDIAARLNTDRSNLWRWRKIVCKEFRRQLRK